MCKKYDLTGQRFGRLVVLGRDIEKLNIHRDKYWLCKCDCGAEKSVTTGHLISGTVRSCGCIKREQATEKIEHAIKLNFRHGEAGTKLYWIWFGMKRRCVNHEHKAYKYYGGKGIKVCDEWNDFTKFAEWARSNGYIDQENTKRSERLSIDRIDSNKDYCPENCRWITVRENSSRANRHDARTGK